MTPGPDFIWMSSGGESYHRLSVSPVVLFDRALQSTSQYTRLAFAGSGDMSWYPFLYEGSLSPPLRNIIIGSALLLLFNGNYLFNTAENFEY